MMRQELGKFITMTLSEKILLKTAGLVHSEEKRL